MIRTLTCICCPLGCNITVQLHNEDVLSAKGYTCKRGLEYANSECVNPVRIVTSTVMTDIGIPLSVKTKTPIPKDKIFACMGFINSLTVKTPVKIGDIILKDVFGTDIVATASL